MLSTIMIIKIDIVDILKLKGKRFIRNLNILSWEFKDSVRNLPIYFIFIYLFEKKKNRSFWMATVTLL